MEPQRHHVQFADLATWPYVCTGTSGTSVILIEHAGDALSTASDTFSTSGGVLVMPPLQTAGTGDRVSSTTPNMVGCKRQAVQLFECEHTQYDSLSNTLYIH